MDSVADKVITAQTNLNYTEFLVLLALHDIQNPTQEAIAKWANFTKSTASKTIDKLVKKNLLNRTENSKDRRQKDVTITPQGESQFQLAK
ncbi:MAG: MarR family transcriptional regulator, partial [Flammeovirgaceae bacterium]